MVLCFLKMENICYITNTLKIWPDLIDVRIDGTLFTFIRKYKHKFDHGCDLTSLKSTSLTFQYTFFFVYFLILRKNQWALRRNLTSYIASKTHYGTFLFESFTISQHLLEIGEQLSHIKILLLFDHGIWIFRTVFPLKLLWKQLLTAYFH